MANTEQNKGPRTAKAEHIMLDANGAVTENETEARGIRYVHLATGGTFDYIPKSEAAKAMLAWFGAKTLATNEASAVRQKYGDNEDPLPAIKDRFDVIDAGDWVDRTREGGVKIDRDKLCTAAVEVMHEAGKITDDQKADYWAKLRQKLEDDPKAIATMRNVAGVEAKYRALVGREAKSVDDLAALVS